MPKDLFSRYIWLVDTIRRHGTITRATLDEKWRKTPFSNGQPLSRRTFYNYRNAIEELFQVSIICDPVTYEYHIEQAGPNSETITNWLLNSMAMNEALSGSREISDRIFLEEVPSAHNHLDVVIEAVKGNHPIRFAYHPYTRSKPTPGIVIEPYFLKIFRQRWYITGRNIADRKIKTYALDRMNDIVILPEKFEIPADFDAPTYFRDSFGIIFDEGTAHEVMLRATPRKAKYLRALPLHHSQSESLHDDYSIFTYRLKLTPDFVSELLSHGPDITVIRPAELRAMMVASLRASLDNYNS